MEKSDNKIDFLVLWVDGSDEEWLVEKKLYKPDLDISDSIIRFRDWENLKYWFRGVEKNAPWVNNVYFITYGHLPKFLNVDNPKLKIINHKDYIDGKYLPTYNSNVIDLNINKIKELNEHFVYFNDDMFIIDKVKPTDFFVNGLPKDEFAETAITPDENSIFPYMRFNNTQLINKRYNKKRVYKSHFFKYYNYKYGFKMFRTLLSSPYKKFLGFYNPHLPQAFLKSYFDKLWELYGDDCENTSSNRFRTREDITQYLVRNLQLVDGNFVPRSSKFGKMFVMRNNNEELISAIENKKYKLICMNDNEECTDFEKAKKDIIKALEKIYPEKSSFEK